MRSLTLAMCVAFSATASAETRLYPICFYSSARPDLNEVMTHYVPTLERALRAAAYLSQHTLVVPSPDGRWLLADTSNHQHARISRVWPRLACIGNATNSATVRLQRSCIDFIKTVLRSGQYEHFAETEVQPSVLGEHVFAGYAVFCRTATTRSDP